MEALPGIERDQVSVGQGATGTLLRWRRGLPVAAPAAPSAAAAAPPPPPLWLTRPAPPEPRPARPLAPSHEDEAVLAAATLAGPLDEAAARFGRHAHRLLQLLAGLDPAQRGAALERYLTVLAQDLSADARARLAERVGAVLSAPALAALFGPGSRAEVAIVGRLGEVVVSGQIDRLVVTPDEVLVVDFKTGRAPPASVDAVPVAYLRQMALYRALLGAIHPGRRVRAALVWTETLAVQTLPDALLDRHLPPGAALTAAEPHP
jgi:ATP-dependent helicase/nuclease subunit A